MHLDRNDIPIRDWSNYVDESADEGNAGACGWFIGRM